MWSGAVKCQRCERDEKRSERCSHCNGTGIESDLTLLTDYHALLRWLSQDENSAAAG